MSEELIWRLEREEERGAISNIEGKKGQGVFSMASEGEEKKPGFGG